jgi:hypothetical protein
LDAILVVKWRAKMTAFVKAMVIANAKWGSLESDAMNVSINIRNCVSNYLFICGFN